MKTCMLVIILLSLWIPHGQSKCKTDPLTAAEQAVLTAHNANRALHIDTPDLCYGESEKGVMTYKAQEWADQQATDKRMYHSDNSYRKDPESLGENLAYRGTTGTIDAIEEAYVWAANAWYSEIENWDFAMSEKKAGIVDTKDNSYGQTGHFTALVWKSTTEVRCGYATYTEEIDGVTWNNYIVCCQYYEVGNMGWGDPAGPYNKFYVTNVLPLSSSCPAPTVADGTVTPIGPINSAASYTVTCDTGYKISGSASVACTEAGGKADLSELPTCITTPCAKPTVPNGEVTPTTDIVAHGEKYQLTCNQGYLPTSLSSFECDGSTGDLTPESLECEVDNNTEPTTTCTAPTVANGVVSPAGPIQSDASYAVTCDTGYKISGSPSVKCSDKNGVATLDQLPTCITIPTTCAQPTVPYGEVIPAVATVAGGQTYQVTFKLTYTCDGTTGNLELEEDDAYDGVVKILDAHFTEKSESGGMSKLSAIGATILVILYTS